MIHRDLYNEYFEYVDHEVHDTYDILSTIVLKKDMVSLLKDQYIDTIVIGMNGNVDVYIHRDDTDHATIPSRDPDYRYNIRLHIE